MDYKFLTNTKRSHLPHKLSLVIVSLHTAVCVLGLFYCHRNSVLVALDIMLLLLHLLCVLSGGPPGQEKANSCEGWVLPGQHCLHSPWPVSEIYRLTMRGHQ